MKLSSFFKLVLLILLFVSISISSKTRSIIDISLKQISSFLLLAVKYEDREKWIIDNPNWIPNQKIMPSY